MNLDGCAVPRRRIDRHLAASKLNALAHTESSGAPTANGALKGASELEADPVILDLHLARFIIAPQLVRDILGLGVSGNINERLLSNPEACRLKISREPDRVE